MDDLAVLDEKEDIHHPLSSTSFINSLSLTLTHTFLKYPLLCKGFPDPFCSHLGRVPLPHVHNMP